MFKRTHAQLIDNEILVELRQALVYVDETDWMFERDDRLPSMDV